MRSHAIRPAVIVAANLGLTLHVQGQSFAPYEPDAQTLHLWHFEESRTPAADSGGGSDPVPLFGLINGARLLSGSSVRGLGGALKVNAGTAYNGGLAAARVLAEGPSDNIAVTVADRATGAFTMEALVKFDASHDPLNEQRGLNMEILSMDGEEPAERVFLFRYKGATPERDRTLEFTNLMGGPAQSLEVKVPIEGPNAINNRDWFHVAVSYNGKEMTPDNLAFYWTKLGAGITRSNWIGSSSMSMDLITTPGDFVIGNEGRTSPDEGFPGWIDEVRISKTERTAETMMPSRQSTAPSTPSAPATPAPELVAGFPDTDGDGLPDNWEKRYFGNLAQAATNDPDGDGLTNLVEVQQGGNPAVAE